MKLFALLFLLMAIAIPAFANDALTRAVSSLDLSAGIRFTPGAHPGSDTENQFYIGAGFRVPLAARARLFADFDRDFVDRPAWQSRAGISFAPFGD